MGVYVVTKSKGVGRGGKRTGAGRPVIGDTKMQKYEVTLPDDIAEYVRSLGTPTQHEGRSGNLSDGIRKLAEWHRSQDSPPLE